MTLQWALVLLGLAALALIIGISFLQGREGVRTWFARLRSATLTWVRRISGARAWAVFRPGRLVDRVRQREPSLVATQDFASVGESAPQMDPPDTASQTSTAGSARRSEEPVRLLGTEIGGAPVKIDYWIRVAGKTPVMRDVALAIFREHEIDLSHPRSIHGRTEPGNAWLDLATAQADERFSDLIVSLQMADRDSAVDESELTRFNNLAYSLAEALDRSLQFDSSIEEALPQAVRLEHLCREFDLLAVINIEPPPGAGFSGPEVVRVMERAGMRLGELDIFHFFDSRTGVSRFSLGNRSEPGGFSYEDLESGTLRGLALFMNVPRVAQPARTFAELGSVAQYVSAELNGSLVDPDGAALSSAQFEAIRRQIQSIESSMKGYGIEPGSDEARRLF